MSSEPANSAEGSPSHRASHGAPAAPRRGGIAQHGRLGSAGGGPGAVVKWLAIGLATVLVGVVATAALAVAQLYNSISFVDGANILAGPSGSSAAALQSLDGGFNFLMVGTDTREGQKGHYTDSGKTSNLADVIILLHVSEDHQSATAVSFPRDLMVPIPSCPKTDGSGSYPAMSKQQINSSIGYGGVYCTVLTIESLTGLDIPYYALIDFNGVIEMTNAVGGVTVCSTGAVHDSQSGLTLTEGENTLKGKQALAFLRTRHGFGDASDLSRISAQQVYLSALMRKMTSAGTLSNPVTLYALAAAAAENVKMSKSLANPSTMVSMAAALSGVDLKKMVFVQAPTTSDPANTNRVVLAASADKLFTALQNDKAVKLSSDSTGRGAVLDSSSAAASSSAASPSSSATASGSSSAASSAAASPTTKATTLPSGVTGQTAADETCAKVRAQ